MTRLAGVLLLLLLALPARAATPFDPFAAVDLLDRSGAQVPLDAVFQDAGGRTVRLGDLLHGQPAILAPVYYRCPNVCSVTLANLMTGLSTVPLRAGADYTVIAVSIDPREGAAAAREAREKALHRLRGAGDGTAVRFLTGDRDSIDRVTEVVGFRYAWDERTQQYAHAAAVAVLTPDGRVARWLYGVGYQPEDLRLALLEAGGGRIGGFGDKLLLLCHSYDPTTGSYTSIVRPILMTGAGLTLALLAGFVGISLWRDGRRSRR